MKVRILIIDDDPQYHKLLARHIKSEWADAEVRSIRKTDQSADGPLIPEGVNASDYNAVLLDRAPSGKDGLKSLREFKRRPGFPPVIFIIDRGNELLAVEAVKAGAEDYLLREEINHDRFIASLRSAIRKHKRTSALLSRRQALDEACRFGAVKIRGHRFIRELGSGGISSVYLAEGDKVKGLVVLKVFRLVPEILEAQNSFDRFIQEYELISRIEHPNIVRIFDLGVADDHVYITMEYFKEGSLRAEMNQALPAATALDYLRQIADALMAIHDVGILHRDLKPANVMFREDRSIVLIDFGLAKQMTLDQEITGSGEIFGTPYYMSPEQGHAGQVDERSDIYSVGVMAFEMLSGEKPFTADTPMAVIYKHSNTPLPRLGGALAEFQELLDKMLAKDPHDRFQSAEELLAYLDSQWPRR
ncbi:serine/threonine-protein kinase PK-1 [bacterium MnTg04]|nr:serine/threonine-protein kinase PK-1 [bacterium MnTg04]